MKLFFLEQDMWHELWDVIESSRDRGLPVDRILSTIEEWVVEVRKWVNEEDWDEED